MEGQFGATASRTFSESGPMKSREGEGKKGDLRSQQQLQLVLPIQGARIF